MAVSCTSHKIAELPPFIFDANVYRIEKDGVVIGVDPYFGAERIEDAFYVDMSKAGFYPIRLRISNLTSNRLVIDRGAIHLVAKTGEKYAAVSSADVVKELRHKSAAYGALGFGIFSFMDAEEANAQMINATASAILQELFNDVALFKFLSDKVAYFQSDK